MPRVVNLTTQGQVSGGPRIFSITGCNLLGFFTNMPRAKQFRAWAKQELAGQAPVPPRLTSGGRGRKMIVTRRMERAVLELFVAGWRPGEIAREVKRSGSTISQLLHGKYSFSPAAGENECSPELMAAVAMRHMEYVRAKQIEENERLPGARPKAAGGRTALPPLLPLLPPNRGGLTKPAPTAAGRGGEPGANAPR
ncbi:MAG: hypothetical protein IPJ52_00110 [Rhodocyclaceae bacterium]|nr:hypothetical protein [Rhodocyclaceae bacterium]